MGSYVNGVYLPTSGVESGWGPELNDNFTQLAGERYNVKSADYGALGTGSGNDGLAIQEAINECGADGGGNVYIPPGTYPLGANYLSIDYADGAGFGAVNLIGAGHGATTLTYTGAGPGIFWGTSETGLSNPRTMGELRGFSVDGPGKATAGGVAVQIMRARYFFMHDVYAQDCETAFQFHGGDVFLTGGECHRLRCLDARIGYHLTGNSANECTDMKMFNCYANSGYGAALSNGTIGFHLERANTNSFFGCSEEAYQVGYQLCNTDETGQALRNAFYYCRDEISGATAETVWHEAGLIFDGTSGGSDDNFFCGTKGPIRDYTANQSNVIIGKRDISRSGLDTEHRLVRNLDMTFSATGATTDTDATLTTTDRTFNPYDVGRPLFVENGSSGPALKTTTVASFTNATSVEMASAASNTASGQDVMVQAAIPSASATSSHNLMWIDRIKSDDRLVAWYYDQDGAVARRDLIAGTDF